MAQRRTKPGRVIVHPEGKADSAPKGFDRDRRRALLLSLLVHAGVLLTVTTLSLRPLLEEPEKLIVLELTPPQGGAAEADAAAVDAPAPERSEAQASGNAAADVAAEVEAPSPETSAVPTETTEREPTEDVSEAVEAPAPREPAPQAQVPQQSAPLPELPPQAPSTTLPEVEAPEIAPQPLEQAISLPTPEAQAEVIPAQQIAVTPQVEVAAPTPLPMPEASVSLVTEPIVIPQAGADVAAAEPIPQPAALASVVERSVPQPAAAAEVAEASPIPQPAVSGAATAAAPLPQPSVGATVAEARPLAVTPEVSAGSPVTLVTPEVQATVTLPEPAEEVAGDAAASAADAGDAANSGQNAAAPDDAAGQGAAADGSGTAETGVANVQSFQVSAQQPLAVLLDNADDAYPQQGLVQASSVYEMPVEGGMTRLMSVYTRGDPVQVGPIRSARDYFLEAALQLNGTLVHVGGAPSTVNRIASQNLPTLDALQQGALFAQAPDRLAPHSTFSTGTALRDAVGRSETQVSGTIFVPPAEAPDVTTLDVRYSEVYSSGFRYLSDLDLYRWVRSGADAADTEGEAVTADAVVVAQVTAFPYPDDPEGRLYLPYSGGAATLYLRGKAVAGSWTPEGGFSFVAESGIPVDLRPFKTWLLFAPETAEVAQN